MTKSVKRAKAPPKTSRERKAAFDDYMKNRGGADPSRPERWATVFFLTKQSADAIARIREEARFEGSQPAQNAAIFEDMLRVYVASRRRAGGPDEESPLSSNVDAVPPAKLTADLVAFANSVEKLRQALQETDEFQDQVLEEHRSQRWIAFERLIHRLQGPCSTGQPSIDEGNRWHREFEDYLDSILSLASDVVGTMVKLPARRGPLFSRVLKRLKLG